MRSLDNPSTRHINESHMDGFTDEPISGVPQIATAPEIEAGKLILNAVEKKLAFEQEIVDNRPKRDEMRIQDDLYFKLGMIYMCNWVLSLPRNARAWCDEQKEHDE